MKPIMLKSKNILLLVCFIAFITIINYALSEVVITKDGSKYIGKVTDEDDKIKISTADGELTIKKDRIKAIYKDAATIVKETNDILKEAQELIAGANKIQDPKERNATLDKALEMLRKGQDICMDVIDVFSGKDAEAISNQFKEINGAIKHANSLKVMKEELPTPPKEPTPDNLPPVKPKPEIDPRKLEAAQEIYGLGLDALNDKKHEKARDYFMKAISFHEDFVQAYAKLGDTYMTLKKEELAFESYLKCIEGIDRLESPNEEMTKLRKEVLVKTEKFRVLEEKFTALNNEFSFKLMEFGNQCIKEEDYLLAEEIFSLILQIEENNEEASGCLQKARDLIGELEKEPENKTAEDNELADTYYQSGSVLCKQNKYEEAIAKFNKALSYRRQFPAVLFKLGECYEKLKDNKKAVWNYRLCRKYLQQQSDRSKEEDEMVVQVSRTLDKIDINGKQFLKIKNEYTSKLLALVNECINTRLFGFARRFIEHLLKIDPANKTAQKLLADLGGESPGNQAKTVEKPFNGKNLNNWETLGADQTAWSVQNNKIVADPRENMEAILLSKTAVPKNYSFTVDVEIKALLGNTKSKVCIVGAKTSPENALGPAIILKASMMTGKTYKIEYVKRNGINNLLLNGQVVHKDFELPGTPAVGLMALNARLVFSNIELKELK